VVNRRTGAQVRQRLRSLLILELFNIPFQAGIWFGVIGLPVTVANAVGFGLFTLLLVEGAGYWWAKLRQLERRPGRLPGLKIFKAARLANLPILFAGVAWTMWSVIADPGAGSIPGLVFALMATLEHVNYFHVQLMYDNAADLRYLFRHGLRRAHLSRDLVRRSPVRRVSTPR
jgi:hypothetical protein